jgi:hypothetical protein
MRKLAGGRGDDVLFGPKKNHNLSDALRAWMDTRPEELERLRQTRPNGPLAISHRTGRRKGFLGVERRFDAVWLTPHFRVEEVAYPYEASIEAGSDHSAVVVDISLMPHVNGPGSEDRPGVA